ncbi:hypothetical protein ACM0K4_00215 [Mycoplasma sp. VS42A]|uniref:hypothetical protein n=1 Tax=Mycoplasma sp. VS42A TaxID=3398774 RepID=UPI003A8B5EEB
MEQKYLNNKATTTAYGKAIVYKNPRIIEKPTNFGEIRTIVFVDVIVAGKNLPGQERLKSLTRLQFTGKLAEKAKSLAVNEVVNWVGLPYLSISKNETTLTNYKILTYDVTAFSTVQILKNETDYNVVLDSTYTKIQTVARLLEDPIELTNNTCLRTCFNVQNSEKGIFIDIFTGDKINNIFNYEDFQNIKKGAKIYLTCRPFAISSFSEKTQENYVESKAEMLNYFLVEAPFESTVQTTSQVYEAKVEIEEESNKEQIANMFNFE